MLVLGAVVVVHVQRDDARAKHGDRFGDAYGHVRVAEVEADADVVEMAKLEDGHEVLGSGGVADEIFNQQADAEGAGKGAQVFESGLAHIQWCAATSRRALAKVHHEMPEGDRARQIRGRA